MMKQKSHKWLWTCMCVMLGLWCVSFLSSVEVRATSGSSKGSRTVDFRSSLDYNAVISVEIKDEFGFADIPQPIPYFGFEHSGWKTDQKTYAKTEVNNLIGDIKNNSKIKTVTVLYEPETVTKEFTVTVYDGATQKEYKFKESQWVSFTAQDKLGDGKEFSHWELDGLTISREQEVVFLVGSDCNLTAVHKNKNAPIVLTKASCEIRKKDDQKVVYVLVLEATAAANSGVEFQCIGKGKNGEAFSMNVSAAEDPDGSGKYGAEIGIEKNLSLDEDYDITSVVNGEKGDSVKVNPECGYDIEEKACAVIRSKKVIQYGKDNALQFVAHITAPEGCEIKEAGIIASPGPGQVSFNSSAVLSFNSQLGYRKSWEPAEGKEAMPLTYTWTNTKIVGESLYVRPYVIYIQDGIEHTLLGRRESLNRT